MLLAAFSLVLLLILVDDLDSEIRNPAVPEAWQTHIPPSQVLAATCAPLCVALAGCTFKNSFFSCVCRFFLSSFLLLNPLMPRRSACLLATSVSFGNHIDHILVLFPAKKKSSVCSLFRSTGTQVHYVISTFFSHLCSFLHHRPRTCSTLT